MSPSESNLSPNLLRRMEIKPTLESCERTITRALYAYAEAGEALRIIRDERLYKETHRSFDAYVKERWRWSRRQADHLVAAAQVHDVLYDRTGTENNCSHFEPPRTEAAARELAPLRRKPKQLAEVWAVVVEKHGPEAEAKHVRKAVADVLPTAQPSQDGGPPLPGVPEPGAYVSLRSGVARKTWSDIRAAATRGDLKLRTVGEVRGLYPEPAADLMREAALAYEQAAADLRGLASHILEGRGRR